MRDELGYMRESAETTDSPRYVVVLNGYSAVFPYQVVDMREAKVVVASSTLSLARSDAKRSNEG